MSDVDVVSTVEVYAVNGEHLPMAYDYPKPKLIVRSHPIWHDRVEIIIDDGDGTVGNAYTVIARDLEVAIRNGVRR